MSLNPTVFFSTCQTTARITLMVIGLYAALPAAAASASDITFPGTDWESSAVRSDRNISPESKRALDTLLAQYNTQALHVSVAGQQVYTWGDISDDGYLASVRKSLLAMLYGPYVANGTIELDSTLGELGIDDVGGLLPIEQQATVRHLIQARSGIYHDAANGGDSAAHRPDRGSKQPGSYYLYNNWDFNTAGTVFETLTGEGVFDALNEQLAVPLQFQDFDLSKHRKSGDPERSQHLAYHMHISARDLARVGVLMLAKGQWHEQRLFSESWAREMVYPHTSNEEMNPKATRDSGMEYGYMWWVFDDDTSAPAYKGAYAGRGHFGQYLLVLPALDLVIAHKTKAVSYSTPEEYEQVRVNWPDMLAITDAVIEVLQAASTGS